MRSLFLILTLVITFFVQMEGQNSSLNKGEELPPLFTQALADAKVSLELEMNFGIDVPIPKDMAGGYTHERHKANYTAMQLAGNLYTYTDNTKYADYVRDMLLQYAELYLTLPIHPTQKSYATGKLFWQCLNDANFMVYTAQAYDAIYDYLTLDQRNTIENKFFRPYADFISIENPQFFNRIHNHSTWGNAAVGMIGLAIRDDSLVHRALYGLPFEGDKAQLAKDNDGGFIYDKDKMEAGFFAQIDHAFSPDGYYNEGPYYQRYAMLPFMVFAEALNDKKPEYAIFAYRDSLLVKGVKALVHQTNSAGQFFPINDAQKGMSIHASSVVTAVDIAYSASQDKVFIAVAKIQNEVLLSKAGLAVAKKVAAAENSTLPKQPILLRDGKDGDQGAFAILRTGSSDSEINVTYKYTSQGLGHGHYDKLTYAFYDGTTELLQDYGSARWVNIDQKAGGRYLPENNTWAKQTIAHNTLVVDKTSHFNGNYDLANLHHSDPTYFDTSNPSIQVASAKEVNAYNGVQMYRTLVLWSDDAFAKPLLIDVFSVYSDSIHTYDMPYQHAAQLMRSNATVKTTLPSILGDAHGYQHLYQEAEATMDASTLQLNLFKDDKFYTITCRTSAGDKLLFARLGANDPDFNLRRDEVAIHRKERSTEATYVSIIESHGTYSRDTEVPIQPYSQIASLEVLEETQETISFQIATQQQEYWTVTMHKKTGEGLSITKIDDSEIIKKSIKK